MTQRLRVAVTGAWTNHAFFPNRRWTIFRLNGASLQLLELPMALNALKALKWSFSMALSSSTTSLSRQMPMSHSRRELACVGSKPRGPGMERADLIRENVPFLSDRVSQLMQMLTLMLRCRWESLQYQLSHCSAPGKTNQPSKLYSHDSSRRKSSSKSGGNKDNQTSGSISNLAIWGNHSQPCIQISPTQIGGESASGVVQDDEWLDSTFIKTVQQRGRAIVEENRVQRLQRAQFTMHGIGSDQRRRRMGLMAVTSDGSHGVPNVLLPMHRRCGWPHEIVQGIELAKSTRANYGKCRRACFRARYCGRPLGKRVSFRLI